MHARLLAILLLLVASSPLLPAWAQPVTALWYHRTATTYAPEQTRLLQAPADVFSVVQATPGGISLRINWPNSGYVMLELSPPVGGTFAVGPYESARRNAFRGTAPGIELTGQDIYCCADDGRFTVRELVLDSEFQVVSFAADFEQRVDNGPVFFGELRLNSAVPLGVNEPAGSTAPNAFGFVPRTGVAPGTVVVSNTTTIYGINAPAPISVSGGEYSVNGAAFTSAPGSVQNRDRVRVRQAAAATTGTLRSATLQVGGFSAPFSVTTYTPGEQRTVLYFRSEAGDYIGQGATRELASPGYTFQAAHTNGKSVRFYISGPGASTWSFDASSLTGLVPGAYEEAARHPFSGSSPGLSLSGEGSGCNRLTGRFVVFEAEYGPGETLLRFAANFEQHCEGQASTLYGEIRFNSTVPLSYMATGPDNDPEPFRLQAQSPVKAGSLVTSNSVTVMGVSGAVPVSIAGGEYSINGGAYTAAAGTASERDHIRVRMEASRTAGGNAAATLTVGARSEKLEVTTWQQGMVLTGLYYRSPSGDYIGQGATRIYLSPRSNFTARKNYDNGVEIRIDGTQGVSWSANFAAPNEVLLGAGSYPAAMRFPFQSAGRPGVDFSGDGRGCNTIAGSFVVHEVEFGAGDTVTRFAADFEQRCEENGPPLLGEIRFNSTVPLSALVGGACANGDTDGDGVTDCLEEAQGTNPAVKDNDVFANPRLFAMQQYRDFLAREGDAGGIDYWANRLSAGQASRGSVIEQFLNSPEFGGVMAPVGRLYFAYFLRIPDKSGLDFWVDFRLAGNPMESISNYFAQSAEFSNTYGALDNAAFVDRVYRNVLARAPDAGGLAFWKGQLDNNQRTRGQVMLAFSESPEYVSLTTNEIFVTMTYFGMLQRAPEGGGFAYWLDYMDRGNSGLALIDLFLTSSEYRRRFLP